MKLLVILSLLTLSLPNGIEHNEKSVIIKDFPSRLSRENFDMYFLDEFTIEDLRYNFGVPCSFISQEENNKMVIQEATFYTRYGKIKFCFESETVKKYEVLPVDDSFLSPME